MRLSLLICDDHSLRAASGPREIIHMKSSPCDLQRDQVPSKHQLLSLHFSLPTSSLLLFFLPSFLKKCLVEEQPVLRAMEIL